MDKFVFSVKSGVRYKEAVNLFKFEYIVHHLELLSYNKKAVSKLLDMSNKSIYNVLYDNNMVCDQVRWTKYFNDKCYMCSVTGKLEIHHMKPLNDGGTDSIDNWMTLCPICHKKIHEMLGKL